MKAPNWGLGVSFVLRVHEDLRGQHNSKIADAVVSSSSLGEGCPSKIHTSTHSNSVPACFPIIYCRVRTSLGEERFGGDYMRDRHHSRGKWTISESDVHDVDDDDTAPSAIPIRPVQIHSFRVLWIDDKRRTFFSASIIHTPVLYRKCPLL